MDDVIIVDDDESEEHILPAQKSDQPNQPVPGNNAFALLMNPSSPIKQCKKRKEQEKEEEAEQNLDGGKVDTALSGLYPTSSLTSITSILVPQKDTAFWRPTKKRKTQSSVIAQSQVFALQFDKTKRLFGCTFSSLDVGLEAASATPFTLPDIPIVARASATKPSDKDDVEFDDPSWKKYFNENTVASAEATNRFQWRARPNQQHRSPTTASDALKAEENQSISHTGKDSIVLRSFFGSEGSFEAKIANRTNPNDTQDTPVSFKLPTEQRFPLSALKSIFQKSIRRSRVWPSIRLAKTLLSTNYVDFLRRLAIVMVEDALLHPDLPIIVWLMMNQHLNPDFRPGRLLLNQVLRIVYDLASVPCRDCIATAWHHHKASGSPYQKAPSDTPGSNDTPIAPSPAQLDALPQYISDLLKAILARGSFGGMHGDMFMLRAAASIWYRRFTSAGVKKTSSLSLSTLRDGIETYGADDDWYTWIHGVYNTQRTVYVDWNAIGPLQPGDLLLDAIDFHCTPILGKVLSDDDLAAAIRRYLEKLLPPPIDIEGQMRSAMWWFRSGINKKRNILPLIEDSEETATHKRQLNPIFEAEFLRERLDGYSYRYLKQFM